MEQQGDRGGRCTTRRWAAKAARERLDLKPGGGRRGVGEEGADPRHDGGTQ